MIINAVIESKDGGTLVLDFPRSIYDVYEKLQSVGIRQSPHQITLSDEEGDDVRVKLYSEDETGKHLLLTLKEQNSLADANMLAFMVDNAKPDFRSKLEQNLLNDQYSSMQEVTDDIKQMLYESGPVKAVFYCPLVGEVTDEEGFSSPVDGRFLKSYAWAVEEALEADTADDEMDMAEFFDEDDGVKAKLVSAKWGVETYRGRLFGRIECSLKEELTDAETEILTDWISGQNSDGYGEHFEQQPIDTEDGDLYVSFWNSGDNYSIMTRDELDEYRMDLPHRAKSVYIYLADRANKDGECWPAIPTIARELKLSQSTVRRALQDLRKAGFLETEQRYRKHGGKSSLLYSLKR